MPRLIDAPVPYGDWIIPPATPISMTILDVQFNETLYPKPHDFVPERWFGSPKAPDGESMEKYWVAFGKGPRNCIGIKYVRQFDVLFRPGHLHSSLFVCESMLCPISN
jgi:cytochrome P450